MLCEWMSSHHQKHLSGSKPVSLNIDVSWSSVRPRMAATSSLVCVPSNNNNKRLIGLRTLGIFSFTGLFDSRIAVLDTKQWLSEHHSFYGCIYRLHPFSLMLAIPGSWLSPWQHLLPMHLNCTYYCLCLQSHRTSWRFTENRGRKILYCEHPDSWIPIRLAGRYTCKCAFLPFLPK